MRVDKVQIEVQDGSGSEIVSISYVGAMEHFLRGGFMDGSWKLSFFRVMSFVMLAVTLLTWVGLVGLFPFIHGITTAIICVILTFIMGSALWGVGALVLGAIHIMLPMSADGTSDHITKLTFWRIFSFGMIALTVLSFFGVLASGSGVVVVAAFLCLLAFFLLCVIVHQLVRSIREYVERVAYRAI